MKTQGAEVSSCLAPQTINSNSAGARSILVTLRAGSKLAQGILEDTKTEKGVRVAVEGTLEGDTIHATKIAEVAAPVN
jgi:hypothetical protein